MIVAAYNIKYLIDNKKVNVEIGKQACDTALLRHDKKKNIEQLLEIYKNINA